MSNAEPQATSLVTQRFNRVEAGREISGNQRGKRADKKRADANNGNVPWNDFRWNRRKDERPIFWAILDRAQKAPLAAS